MHNFIDARALLAARESVTPPASAGPLQVFVAAKLYPAKGVGSLLEALDAMHAYEQLDLSVAGDGSDEFTLRERYPWVNFLGWQSGEQTLRRTACAHAIVVPSVCEEACASTVLEALTLGKTVFALRLGGTPELADYANAPHQLQLFDDMQSLASALLSFDSRSDIPVLPSKAADARQAAQRLLYLYKLPPGPLRSATVLTGGQIATA